MQKYSSFILRKWCKHILWSPYLLSYRVEKDSQYDPFCYSKIFQVYKQNHYRLILLSFFLCLTISCTNKDPISDLYIEEQSRFTESGIHGSFASQSSIEVTWSSVKSKHAVDITYDLYLDDKLYASDVRDTVYSFHGLEEAKSYKVSLKIKSNNTEQRTDYLIVNTLDIGPEETYYTIKEFKLHSFTSINFLWADHADANGYFALAGLSHPGEVENYKLVLIKFDKNLNLVWYRLFPSRAGVSLGSFVRKLSETQGVFNNGSEICFFDVKDGHVFRQESLDDIAGHSSTFPLGVIDIKLQDKYIVVGTNNGYFFKFDRKTLDMEWIKYVDFGTHLYAFDIDENDHFHFTVHTDWNVTVYHLDDQFNIVRKLDEFVSWYDRQFYMNSICADHAGRIYVFGAAGQYIYRNFIYSTKGEYLSHHRAGDWLSPRGSFLNKAGKVLLWGHDFGVSGSQNRVRIIEYVDQEHSREWSTSFGANYLVTMVQDDDESLVLFMRMNGYENQVIRRVSFE